MIDYRPLLNLKFGGNCLINGNISVFQKVINLYISYKLDPWSRDLNADFTLVNCLFGAVNLIKMLIVINMDIVAIVLNSMHVHNFYYQTVAGAKISLFLELIIVLL